MDWECWYFVVNLLFSAITVVSIQSMRLKRYEKKLKMWEFWLLSLRIELNSHMAKRDWVRTREKEHEILEWLKNRPKEPRFL